MSSKLFNKSLKFGSHETRSIVHIQRNTQTKNKKRVSSRMALIMFFFFYWHAEGGVVGVSKHPYY